MSIFPNVTSRDLNNLCQLTEQLLNQKAIEIENEILKKTHDKKIADSFEPITKNLPERKEYIEKLEEVFEKPVSEEGNLQTPTIQYS